MNAPDRICPVMGTIFSVAMHFGGAIIAGKNYHYDADTDSLIRMDVWEKMMKEDKDARKKWEDSEREKWAKVNKEFEGF